MHMAINQQGSTHQSSFRLAALKEPSGATKTHKPFSSTLEFVLSQIKPVTVLHISAFVDYFCEFLPVLGGY